MPSTESGRLSDAGYENPRAYDRAGSAYHDAAKLNETKSRLVLELELEHLQAVTIEGLRKSEPPRYDGRGGDSPLYAPWYEKWNAAHDRARAITFELAREFGPALTDDRALEVIVDVLERELESARTMAHGWYSESAARRVLELERGLELSRMALDAWKESDEA